MKVITTPRLSLRTWEPSDLEPYWQINQDPLVIEHLPGPLSRERVAQFMADMNAGYAVDTYCCFAVEERESGALIGFVGLWRPRFESHFTPCVEIAWRLGSQYWGKGYATEAAQAVLHYAFEVIGLEEVVAFTVPANIRSQRVMEKLGMLRDLEGDFAHPLLAADHRLSLHVLYRLKKEKKGRIVSRA